MADLAQLADDELAILRGQVQADLSRLEAEGYAAADPDMDAVLAELDVIDCEAARRPTLH